MTLNITKKFILLCLLSLWSALALSDDYSSGYSKYIRGDFAGAENDFRRAAATSSSTRKARALKMLGISHYMQGERTSAEQSFREAKSLDPNVRIAPSEVLDESVLSFFNGIQDPTTPQPAVPSSVSQKSPSIIQTPERIPTYIRIISNIRTAQFSINGQPMGLVNKPTRIQPGVVQVDVTAPGYQRYVGPHRIRPGSENAIRVTLLKINQPTATRNRTTKFKPRPRPKNPPPARITKDIKKKKSRRKNTSRTPNRVLSQTKQQSMHPLIHFLPLGVNHFLQEENTTGAIFGVSQTAFIIYSFLKNSEGNQVTEDTDSTIAQRNEEFSRLTDQNARVEHQQQTNEFYTQRLSYINSVYQESNVAAGLFITTWGASIAYSYLNPPKKSTKTSASQIWVQPFDAKSLALHARWDF